MYSNTTKHPIARGRLRMIAWTGALLVALLALFPERARSQEAEEGEEGELVELSLEELLDVQTIPIDEMGSHIHAKGEFMLGYHYMFMDMDGNRDGTNRLSADEVLQGFPVTPLRMSVKTHMFEFMYGLSDRVTLMAMTSYQDREMDHITGMGVKFTTSSKGLTDTKLMAHIVASHRGAHWWIVTPAISLPTGSIDERGATPMGPDQQLPYPMQLGSGSYEAIPMINYIYQGTEWSSGAHMMAVFSVGDNDRDYKVGNRYHATVFVARKFSESFSLSGRLNGRSMANYSGADPELNPAVVPTADPGLRGGERLDVALGLGFYLTGRKGGAFGHRIIFEVGKPVYQNLDGPQLETDLVGSLAWTWTF